MALLPGGTKLFVDVKNSSALVENGDYPLVVSKRPHVGLCVLSRTRFVKGDILDRFSGEVGPALQQHSLQVRPGLHISATRFIGNLTHGCDPNCRLDMDRFELVALRDIAADELLSIDYAATEDILFRQFACSCDALECRRWITGRAEAINQEGRRMMENGRAAEHL